MPEVFQSVVGCTAAFVLTLVCVRLLRPLAIRFGLVDQPGGRKVHALPTPLTGGLAMLGAVTLATALQFDGIGRASVGFGMAALILTALGVLDDKFDVSWRWRLAVQVGAAWVMAAIGGIRIEQVGDVFGSGSFALGYWSVPFTVFATVGIINAVNMIDGEDGLAGTLVMAAFIMLGAAAVYSGNVTVYTGIPVLVGALAGFLVHNLRLPGRAHARIFMGNSGSAFLGLAIACFCFRLTQNPAHPVGPILALWLLPIPVMDCLVLMVRRLHMRRSPFAADRGHIHHLMQQAGFGPIGIIVILVGFSFATGLGAALALRAHVPQVVLVSAFVLLCLGYYWLTSRHVRAVAFFRAMRLARNMPQDLAMLDRDTP